MIALSHRPARPRARRPRPSYPRGLTVGALALMAACAGTTVACGSEVQGPNENKPSTGTGMGGNVAGGIEPPWGGGGTGGESQGGAGGEAQGGQGGQAEGGAGGANEGGQGMGGGYAGGLGDSYGGSG